MLNIKLFFVLLSAKGSNVAKKAAGASAVAGAVGMNKRRRGRKQ